MSHFERIVKWVLMDLPWLPVFRINQLMTKDVALSCSPASLSVVLHTCNIHQRLWSISHPVVMILTLWNTMWQTSWKVEHQRKGSTEIWIMSLLSQRWVMSACRGRVVPQLRDQSSTNLHLSYLSTSICICVLSGSLCSCFGFMSWSVTLVCPPTTCFIFTPCVILADGTIM